jgi:hypothetical protein
MPTFHIVPIYVGVDRIPTWRPMRHKHHGMHTTLEGYHNHSGRGARWVVHLSYQLVVYSGGQVCTGLILCVKGNVISTTTDHKRNHNTIIPKRAVHDSIHQQVTREYPATIGTSDLRGSVNSLDDTQNISVQEFVTVKVAKRRLRQKVAQVRYW